MPEWPTTWSTSSLLNALDPNHAETVHFPPGHGAFDIGSSVG
jgi:hypothetical protein